MFISPLQVYLAWNGTDKLSGLIVKIPGVPDMYDHERMSHGGGAVPGLAQIMAEAQKLAKVVDGIIVPSSACLEPVALPYCRELYRKRGQEIFAVGPQAHELCWTDAVPPPPTNTAVRTFLDNAVSQYGNKSVLYISFGCVSALRSQIGMYVTEFRSGRSTFRLQHRRSFTPLWTHS